MTFFAASLKRTQSHGIGRHPKDEISTRAMHMMNECGPVLSPTEKQHADIQERAEQAMLATIYAALDNARQQAADDLRSIGSEETPPSLTRSFSFCCAAPIWKR